MAKKREYIVEAYGGAGAIGVQIARDIVTEQVTVTGFSAHDDNTETLVLATRDFLKAMGFRGAILDFVPMPKEPVTDAE